MIFLSTLSLRRATQNRPRPSAGINNFYPRSPCGERLVDTLILTGSMLFLSTLSLRRATWQTMTLEELEAISIHALLAESDPRGQLPTTQPPNFYPRSPCGERRPPGLLHSYGGIISIHALLAESDSKSAQNSGALLRIWNKFYGDFIFMLTGKAVFYPFCPCFFHIFWCEGTGNFMIAFPSH